MACIDLNTLNVGKSLLNRYTSSRSRAHFGYESDDDKKPISPERFLKKCAPGCSQTHIFTLDDNSGIQHGFFELQSITQWAHLDFEPLEKNCKAQPKIVACCEFAP